MIKRRDCVICATFTYLISIILFFVLKEKALTRQICSFTDKDICVRFCCHDMSTCKDTFIRKNFNTSLLLFNQNKTNTEIEIKILYGQPPCSLESIGSEENWNFHAVSLNISFLIDKCLKIPLFQVWTDYGARLLL